MKKKLNSSTETTDDEVRDLVILKIDKVKNQYKPMVKYLKRFFSSNFLL